DGKIIFVKQYRKPLDKTLLEITAGKLEPNEAKEITAIRKIEGESGFSTRQSDDVTSFNTSPGYADELMHLYYTDSLQELDEKVAGDDDEFIELVTLSLDEAEDYMNEQHIQDAKTAYALLYLKTLG